MGMLVNPYRHSAATWQPSSLASLKAWFVADDIGGSNGAHVTSWTDRVASLAATGGSDPDTPTLVVPGLNGLKTIQWNGAVATASGQQLAMGTSIMGGESAGCYFAVKKSAADPASSAERGCFMDGFGSSGSESHNPYSDGNIYEDFGTTVRKTVGNPTPSLAAWRLLSAFSAASDFRYYLDGTQIFSTATNTVNFGTGTRYFGRSAGANGFSGELAEVIIFNSALSTSDRQKVEGYLAWKYGLQANLPGGHPYLAAPPA